MGLALGVPLNAESASATVIDFEGLPSFHAPAASIPGITISPGGGIADEAAIALVTGVSFPTGSVATSGSSVLGNLFASTFSIVFDAPADNVSLNTVGSLGSGAFGTVIVDAVGVGGVLATLDTTGALIGDSGAPEAVIDFGALGGITSLTFRASTVGTSTFVIDDLIYTPEPGTALLLGIGLAALAGARKESK